MDKLQKFIERKSIDELVDVVVSAFHLLSAEMIDHCLMTLQVVMGEIIQCGGDNNYRMLYLGKICIVKVFGIMPQYICLKPQAINKARSICQEERALWQELFGEEEEEEPDWLF